MDERTYPDEAKVEVWRAKRGEWVRGTVRGYASRDGVWKYLVQLTGYTGAHASGPNSWFAASELRAVD